MSHIPAVGSKAQVFHGTAKHTPGGLTKKDLMKHHGRIISRKKHAAGKKAIKHLRALGFIAKKGTFKLMESKTVMNTIRLYAADDAHVIYGAAYDESLGDQMRVTVIADDASSADVGSSRKKSSV